MRRGNNDCQVGAVLAGHVHDPGDFSNAVVPVRTSETEGARRRRQEGAFTDEGLCIGEGSTVAVLQDMGAAVVPFELAVGQERVGLILPLQRGQTGACRVQ
ncbi:hypothetical protein D3C86_1747720 [compost metagenome]